MTADDRRSVLVAIVNNRLDFDAARNQHWYRVPISSANKWLSRHWPPEWLALYHTKIFGALAHGIHYYARILDIREVYRWQLFPNEPDDERGRRQYYQLRLEPLRELPQPIFSRRLRRIVFIPTTWTKFVNATEINDLYDESPLEDRLWAALKRRGIFAERQEFVQVARKDYALDFAIYCRSGRIDAETDGDTWHANPEKAREDNLRDNALETAGWKVLRFTTPQIQEQLETYCVHTIAENIDRLDGLDDRRLIPKRFNTGAQQMGLFDDNPTG